MAAPTERLPWLHDDPPAKADAVAQPGKGGSMWPWYLLLLLLVAAVGAGAWWLSTGREAAPPQLPAEQSLPIPVTETQPAEQALTPEPLGNETAPVTTATQPAPTTTARPRPNTVQRSSTASAPADYVDEEATTARSIFPADDAAPAPPPTGPNPVVAYNPRPYGGRVVQLGAFPTRKQAEDEWKRITRRYPYLTTKPKMVNTVDVRGLGGGRPTRMYRLQLGTSSQAQSVVICQRLERAGLSCVVVY
ncbi:SPOR domain-containing protein [Sphingomonas sp. LHG3443-2]|uniref:SPOR domain-containing protein n=1 Tax=Sphingomonas sp. LHG3443-2 TaxID=2804639 RepID=UPI003CF77D2C